MTRKQREKKTSRLNRPSLPTSLQWTVPTRSTCSSRFSRRPWAICDCSPPLLAPAASKSTARARVCGSADAMCQGVGRRGHSRGVRACRAPRGIVHRASTGLWRQLTGQASNEIQGEGAAEVAP